MDHPADDSDAKVATVFRCDEAACKKDVRFYEAFEIDERWEIIQAILDAAVQS